MGMAPALSLPERREGLTTDSRKEKHTMNARTVAQRTADELRFHGIRGEVAVFSAPSKSEPGKHNVIVRDVVTGEFHRYRTGTETGRQGSVEL